MVLMSGYSTREAAKKLGVTHACLSRYISAGKIPEPKTVTYGKFRVHVWSDADIEHVRNLLPKIANGRKTRYKKQKKQTKKSKP
jgi:predicted DNA-binding transcriptional regulator AlpA